MNRLMAVLFLAGVFAAAAQAATVTITFTAQPSGTPAPGTTLLVTLGLLFAFLVFRKKLRSPVVHPLAAILLLAGVSLFVGRQHLVPQASATGATEFITGASPFMFTIADGGGAAVANNTGGTILITNVTVGSPDILITPSLTPQCQAGLTLVNGGTCNVLTAAVTGRLMDPRPHSQAE
ncbi:MAG TPA: hypothetical protein VGR73_04245 [Bryobacteraceae bacterium]|nr:hypothetical protein [Bryobacteraceae bacterium]